MAQNNGIQGNNVAGFRPMLPHVQQQAFQNANNNSNNNSSSNNIVIDMNNSMVAAAAAAAVNQRRENSNSNSNTGGGSLSISGNGSEKFMNTFLSESNRTIENVLDEEKRSNFLLFLNLI